MGGIYNKLGNPEEALEYYFMSLKIQEAVFGKNHRSSAITNSNIAKVYRKQKKI